VQLIVLSEGEGTLQPGAKALEPLCHKISHKLLQVTSPFLLPDMINLPPLSCPY
jgi:hypothetical protein